MAVKVVTGKVRLSFAHLDKPYAGIAGQEAKYSTMILIPKTDSKTLAKLNAAMDQLKKEEAATWGGKVPATLHTPLRDGDTERPGEDVYKGMYFLNASSKRQPVLIDMDGEEILDPNDMYSGCYARVSLNLFAYSASGNKGIGAGLNAVKKLEDGPRLGGGGYDPSDFEDDEDLM